MVKMSLEKKLKQKAWHHDCITEVVELETAQKELGLVAQQIRERMNSQEVEKEAILKTVNEDQQMLNASQQAALRSSYWISGYVQAMEEVLGLLVEDSKTAKER